MTRTSWLLGLIVVAQVASCAIEPALVLRPAAELLGACETWASPAALVDETFWCVPAGQGDWHPSGWLLVVALAVLSASVVTWLLPVGALLARFHDHRIGRSQP